MTENLNLLQEVEKKINLDGNLAYDNQVQFSKNQKSRLDNLLLFMLLLPGHQKKITKQFNHTLVWRKLQTVGFP
jgi:hypothetical protein